MDSELVCPRWLGKDNTTVLHTIHASNETKAEVALVGSTFTEAGTRRILSKLGATDAEATLTQRPDGIIQIQWNGDLTAARFVEMIMAARG